MSPTTSHSGGGHSSMVGGDSGMVGLVGLVVVFQGGFLLIDVVFQFLTSSCLVS